MADDLKSKMVQLEAAVAVYKLKHGKMPSEEPEPFSVRLQQDNIELIQQTRELRVRIAELEAQCARLREGCDFLARTGATLRWSEVNKCYWCEWRDGSNAEYRAHGKTAPEAIDAARREKL